MVPTASDLQTLASLPTEARHAATETLDALPTLDMLTLMSDEDVHAATAVRFTLPSIAAAVEAIADRFGRGGRLFYLGAGTSGRLGVLDASECPPTFSVPAEQVQGIIAGGDRALRLSSEHSEDDPALGAQDLQAAGFSAADTLVGIAASGRTPYVLGGLAFARGCGALTVGLSCVPGSPVAEAAQIAITPDTGPEILTGSTRLKAGTATKLVLNMLSTGVMVRTGATFGNLMVNVRPTNAKLLDRAIRIVAATVPCTDPEAALLLSKAGDDVKTAILMGRLQLARPAATERLRAASGILRAALEA